MSIAETRSMDIDADCPGEDGHPLGRSDRRASKLSRGVEGHQARQAHRKARDKIMRLNRHGASVVGRKVK